MTGTGVACPQDVQEALGVSRETTERLEAFVHILLAWNRRIGLVGRTTVAEIWTRHILDCGQLFQLIPNPRGGLVDLGSGAGLPGLVLAILGVEDVHLVEANQRKAVFLREAARATGTTVMVHATRIDAMQPISVATVTARALAPVDQLLAYGHPFLSKQGICLFLKGASVETELTSAKKNWKMSVNRYPSLSDSAGVILRIQEICRAQ